jgi:hypothetical protein
MSSTDPRIDATTVISLLFTLLLLGAAYFASLRLLPQRATTRTRVLFIWHAFDALIHTFLEGPFLYHCFFTYATVSRPEYLSALVDSAAGTPRPNQPPLVTAPGVWFLGREGRLYGPGYFGAPNANASWLGPLASLWQIYARADKRWGGADLGVVSLEMLTVFIGAPLAAYVCWLLVREGDIGASRRLGGRAMFWMTVLAVGELYGGKLSPCFRIASS